MRIWVDRLWTLNEVAVPVLAKLLVANLLFQDLGRGKEKSPGQPAYGLETCYSKLSRVVSLHRYRRDACDSQLRKSEGSPIPFSLRRKKKIEERFEGVCQRMDTQKKGRSIRRQLGNAKNTHRWARDTWVLSPCLTLGWFRLRLHSQRRKWSWKCPFLLRDRPLWQ